MSNSNSNSSSILYKFKSGTTFESLPLPGTHAKLLDVKTAIVKQKKLNVGSLMDFDLVVVDATTQQVFDNDAHILPRGTRIIVQRRAVPKGQGILAKIARAEQGYSTTASTHHTNALQHSDLYTIDGSQGYDPEEFVTTQQTQELAALRAATDASNMTLSASAAAATGNMPSNKHNSFRPAGSGPPPSRHHHKQHHHQQQSYRPNADPELRETEIQPKKRATGIPRTFLSLTANTDDDNTTTNTKNKQLIQPNTMGFEALVQRAGGMSESAAGQQRDWEYALQLTATDIPDYLQCAICHGVVSDAMLLPWDSEGRTTCESCIRTALSESGFVCPVSHQEGVSPDDLLPNVALRKAATTFVNSVLEKVKEIDQQANVDEDIVDEASAPPATAVLDDEQQGVILTRRTSAAQPQSLELFGGKEDVFGGDVFAASTKKETDAEEEKATTSVQETQPKPEKSTPSAQTNTAKVKEEVGAPTPTAPAPVKSEPETAPSSLTAPIVVKQESSTTNTPPAAESSSPGVKVEEKHHDEPHSRRGSDSGGRRRGPPVGYTMGPAGGGARAYSPREDDRRRGGDEYDRRRNDDRRSVDRSPGRSGGTPKSDRSGNGRRDEHRREDVRVSLLFLLLRACHCCLFCVYLSYTRLGAACALCVQSRMCSGAVCL